MTTGKVIEVLDGLIEGARAQLVRENYRPHDCGIIDGLEMAREALVGPRVAADKIEEA